MTGVWDYISVGPDPWGAGEARGYKGDILKFDVGVLVAGYSLRHGADDVARTTIAGRARASRCADRGAG